MLVACCALAHAMTPEESERWLESDETDVSSVNSGELEFFTVAPSDDPVHHHRNALTLLPRSLAGGWVGLEQCHDGLDAVPDAEIVFGADRVRDLRVVEARRIGRAWVDGNRVQLRDIERDARLCVAGQLRLISDLGDDRYMLRSGPYMRRFLDGFYPMRVSLSLDLAAVPVRVDRVRPQPQPGFAVRRRDDGVDIDALFAGRLVVEVELIR